MKKFLALAAGAVLSLSILAGCGGGGGTITPTGGKRRVTFLYTGDGEVGQQIDMLIKAYNNGQGEEDRIEVRSAKVADSGYDSKMQTEVYATNGVYDVFCTRDEYFKRFAQYLEPLDSYEGAQAIAESVYPNQINRLRYDTTLNTSNATDTLYALPLVNNISVMYYNKTLLEQVGITCISVEEKDLAAFNNGAADENGKTKADYNLGNFVVPAKGFYRENAFTQQAGVTNGEGWTLPASGERMIYNDRIAMNWDEVEDIAMIMTKSKNTQSPTDYGYHTEWWFAYGWSVGGDCVEDVSGNGDWKYTLPDATSNYIVAEGQMYTGAYTGTTYSAGETLEFLDKLNVNKGDTVVANDDNTFTVNGTEVVVRPEVAEKVADGTLYELPSTREAFTRFAMLAGEGGLNVCPKPADISNAITFFNSGRLAFCVESLRYIADVQKAMGQRHNEWGVTVLPVYKSYNEDGTVAVQGKQIAHSLGYGISINSKSQMKSEAWKFVSWMATEGQGVLAENGYFSSRPADEEAFKANTTYPNAEALISLNATSLPGDWWYMPDRSWINTWADPLNSKVRNGQMSLETFFAGYTGATNELLAAYKK